MARLQTDDCSIFEHWLAEEQEYLQALPEQAPMDALKIEYLSSLKKLRNAEYVHFDM